MKQRSDSQKFEDWVETLNRSGREARSMVGTVTWVHDTVDAAKMIAKSIYGESWESWVLDIYDRIVAHHLNHPER